MTKPPLLAQLHNPIKVGFLTKKGKNRKNWNERWFVLHTDLNLYYFRKSSPGEKSAGFIPISGAIIKTPLGTSEKDLQNFNIITPNRTYFIKCPDIATCNEWREVLIKVSRTKSAQSDSDQPTTSKNPEFSRESIGYVAPTQTSTGVPTSISDEIILLKNNVATWKLKYNNIQISYENYKKQSQLQIDDLKLNIQKLKDDIVVNSNSGSGSETQVQFLTDRIKTILQEKSALEELLKEKDSKIRQLMSNRSSSSTSGLTKLKTLSIDQKALKSSVRNIRSPGSKTTWIVVRYTSDPSSSFKIKKNSVEIKSSGAGDLKSARPFILSEFPAFVFFVSKVHNMNKLFAIIYLPRSVSGTTGPNFSSPGARSKINAHFDELCNFINGFSQINFRVIFNGNSKSLDSFDNETVLDMAIGKSHQGNGIGSHSRRSSIGSVGSVGSVGSNSSESDRDILSRRGGKTGALHIQNQPRFEALVTMVSSGASGSPSWLLLGYSENSNSELTIQYKDSPDHSGIEGLKSLLNSEQIQYCLIRIIVGDSFKNICVSWIGPECKPLLKARSSVHRGSLVKKINKIAQIHGECQILNLNDFSEETFWNKISGSKLHSNPRKSKNKSFISPVSASSSSTKGVALSTMSIADPSGFENLVEKLAQGLLSWILFDIDSLNPSSIIVKKFGNDEYPLAIASQELDDQSVQFILVSTVYLSSKKRLFCSWIGANASVTLKGRSTLYRKLLYQLIEKQIPLSGEIHYIGDKSQVTDDSLAEKLSGSKMRSETEETIDSSAVLQASSGSVKGGKMSFVDENAFHQAIEDFISGKITGLLLGLSESDLNQIIIQSTGTSGSVSEFKLLDSQIQFILVSTTYASSSKRLLCSWIGKNANAAQRGRSTIYRKVLYDLISSKITLHGEIQWMGDHTKVNDDSLAEKLSGSKMRSETEETIDSSAVLQASSGSVKGGKMSFVDENAFHQAIEDFISGKITCLLLGLSESDLNQIIIQSTGTSGSVSEFKLLDSQIQFILVCTTYASSSKRLLCSWIGKNANAAQRGRSTIYRKVLYDLISSKITLHGEIQWMGDHTKVNDDSLAEKLSGSKMRSETEETS